MKFCSFQSACTLVALAGGCSAFAPSPTLLTRPSTVRAFGLDPQSFADLSQHVQHQIPDAFSSLAIAADDVVLDAASDVVDAAAASSGDGWFGFLKVPIESLLMLLHSGLVAVGLSANAWGFTIIAITLLIKLVTFPLTKTQLESTTKMQAMQPAIKELQAKYQSNPEVMNQKMAEFYQTNEINPLAGCLPSLAQIPIFIGLYRAVLELAKENQLDESFLWLPSLEGPTYGADPATGSDWILKGWTDGVPTLGWDDTLSFLILPVLLVVSQLVSMELMQPKTKGDDTQQQTNAILKVLPLLIGWFSLNVPSALCVYWFANNIITTTSTLAIRASLNTDDIVPAAGGAATAASTSTTIPPTPAIFQPPPEKPSGFGESSPAQSVGDDGIKTITAVDAEIVDTPTSASTANPGSKKRGGKKKRKKRKN